MRFPATAKVTPLFGGGERAGAAEPLSDAQLVYRLRAGDGAAAEAIYRRYVGSLYAVTTRLLGRSRDAEDVVQDSFMAAFDEIEDLRDPTQLRGWLMQVAVRKVHRCFRKRKLLRLLGLDRGTDDATFRRIAAPGAPPDVLAELTVVDGLLARLPVGERTAWILRRVEEHPLDEVARLTGCSLATVKRRIQAVDRALQDRLGWPRFGGNA